MATFLELCQNVMRESGISSSGSLSGVVAQTGMNRIIVDAVQNANISIQGKFHDWRFLWAEWTQQLAVGANSGLYNEYQVPAGFGEFERGYGATRIGVNPIRVFDYADVRVMARSVIPGRPSALIVMPNGMARITPIPQAIATLVAEYYRAPLAMIANNEISLIPVMHHRAIETMALAYMTAHIEDMESHRRFMGEYQYEMARLEASQLQGHISRTGGSNEDNMVMAE